MTELNEKLKEETCQQEKEQEAKATLEKALTALLGQVERTRANAVTEFKASHSLSSTPTLSTMVTGLRTT